MVAGGYFTDIPSDKLDLFVAGCSCVDYSNLNSSRAGKTYLPVFDQYPAKVLSGQVKSPIRLDPEFVERLLQSLDTIEASNAGESMRTFLSSMSYIIRTRPKIVILENVDSAPWAAKTNFWFPRAGYVAAHAKVNSRMYYVPQTRQRGYLIAVDVEVFGIERAQAVINQCIRLLKKLERPASSNVTEFLLGPDDPRLVEARADMEQKGSSQKDIDWGFSQVRHEATRQVEGLPATAHPFSMAVFSHGKLMDATPPSRSWIKYFKKQPPRVLDFIDIVILKSLQMQCDLRHKTWVLDVSQNVDRSTVFTSAFASKFGTIGCITPSGQPILTDQMRPITGIEALALQGLPLDDLVLSTETQAQLQDLAGNAMTVPVVGAVMLSIFTAAYEVLQETADSMAQSRSGFVDTDMEDSEPETHVKDVAVWSLGSFRDALMGRVAELVSRAARLCFCPSVGKMTSNHEEWLRCRDCGATACNRCRGNPQHRFEEWTMPRRMSQAELRLQLRSCLPGAFELHADCSDITQVLSLQGCVGSYTSSVTKCVGHNLFYFQHVKVTENVTVEFKSINLVARLVLTSTEATWYLFPIRCAGDRNTGLDFPQPVARGEFARGSVQLRSSAQTLDPSGADWSVWVQRYCDHDFLVEILPNIKEGKVAETLTVRLATNHPEGIDVPNSFPEPVLEAIKERVCGLYRHMPQCGTPEDSLYVMQGGSSKQVFFKHVESTGDPKEDEFVFADNGRQLEVGEYRNVTLKTYETSIPPTGVSFVTGYVEGYWVACEPFRSVIPKSIISRPLGVGSAEAFKMGIGPCCKTGPATLFDIYLNVTELPLPLTTVSRWTNGGQPGRPNFYSVPPTRLEGFLRDIAFACPRIFDAGRSHIQGLALRGRGIEVAFCVECCIAPPKNHWHCPDGTSAARPWEDPDIVERFERRLKMLPPPFAASVKFTGKSFQDHSNGTLNINFTLNTRTLPSRAMAHLAYGTRSGFFSKALVQYSKVYCEVDWCYHPETTLDSLTPFHTAIHGTSDLCGLKEDVFQDEIANYHIDIPCFRDAGHLLRDDQIGAVRWMIGREVCPAAYPETELEEVVLPGMNTRIIGRAIFENDGSILCCRGGVAAHDIGYGKTVLVIALLEIMRAFDSTQSIPKRVAAAALWSISSHRRETFIHLKATLIIVPGHISNQWISEFRKFGSKATIIKIPDVKTLEKQSLATLIGADVIVVSEEFFRSTAYIENIDRLGATPESKSKPSNREAHDRYRTCCRFVRWAVSRYLHNGMDGRDSNKGLELLVEERQQASQRLAQTYASPSSRKGGAKRVKSNAGQKASKESNPDQSRGRKRKVPGATNKHSLLWHPTLFLENFSFSRIIVDEYSYQGASTLSFLSNSLSFSKWLLSGTPPSQNLSNITDVGIALGIHVARPEPCVRPGLPSVTDGPKLHPMSASEEFRSFSTRVKSNDFVMERHDLGLNFVQHFYRSNEADHSSITITEKVLPVRLRIPTAAYYNVAHLEISDANGNLLQVPMELRSLLNAANVTDKNTGEVAANLALASISNGILGSGQWFEDMADALEASTEKFENNAKFYFDKLVWLLDRADSVDPKIQHDAKFQTVRNVAEGIIRTFAADFRGENGGDLSQYGGPLHFLCVMSKIAPPSMGFRHLTGLSPDDGPRALYLPPRDAVQFDKRCWRRDMAVTCWLDWYDIDKSQVDEMDRDELVHLASDLILLSYSGAIEPHEDIERYPDNPQLSAYYDSIKSLFEGDDYENWGLREIPGRRSMLYECSAKPLLERTDTATLSKFVMDCQELKKKATDSFKHPQHINATSKDGKARLREMCRSRNLRCGDADSVTTLLNKINRYNRGLTDNNDHIDGRGTSRSNEFPMLNKIKKARGSGTEATIDEISITYQRYIRNLEDCIQVRRRTQFIDAVASLSQGPGMGIKCDECVNTLPYPSGIFIVVACGHILCSWCKAKIDREHEKSVCSVKNCGAYCRNSPILRWSDLCDSETSRDEIKTCDVNQDPVTKSQPPTGNAAITAKKSEKLEAIINLIKDIDDGDRVLLFVPFVWLAAELKHWFDVEGIKYLCMVTEDKLGENEMSKMAEEFKAGGDSKVLMLNPTEVSCAGINLTIANHVVFAAPFLDSDVHRRNQNMRQAVGRCVRPGQEKPVFVYHFMVENTIEEKVLREYAKNHPIPEENAISLYFRDSPKPWWLLNDEIAKDEITVEKEKNGGGHVPPTSSVPKRPKPPKPAQHTQNPPKKLGPAGGDQLLESFGPGGKAYEVNPFLMPDLWQRVHNLLRKLAGGPIELPWSVEALRDAVHFDKTRSGNDGTLGFGSVAGPQTEMRVNPGNGLDDAQELDDVQELDDAQELADAQQRAQAARDAHNLRYYGGYTQDELYD